MMKTILKKSWIKTFSLVTISLLILITGCVEDDPIIMKKVYELATPYTLELDDQMPIMNIPEDNPLTVEGIRLGRMLFYDPILSADSTQACASCHQQNIGFTDKDKFSVGIDGIMGSRRSMPIINIGWNSTLFWDGRATGVEDQALFPVEDPIEMHNMWSNAVDQIEHNPEYPDLFGEAFGSDDITKERVVKAIAQFERTLISSNSKYDRVVYDKIGAFTDDELEGQLLFYDEEGGDCFHCHDGGLQTDLKFHNNGLDEEFEDLGLYNVTKKEADKGKFKTPSLRNVELRAPYMHDGRFATLKEVLDHYSEGVKFSSTIDPLMKNVGSGGVKLTEEEKGYIIAYLKTMTDTNFINNKDFSSPFD